MVQFYGRDLGTGTSRIVPKIMGMQKVDLPKLDGVRWVFVQLPRVSAESTSYRSSYFYSGSRYGMEYYGVAVSVFDAAGTLIYQAVSAPNLASLAPEKMPPDPPEPIRPRFLGDGMGFDPGVVP